MSLEPSRIAAIDIGTNTVLLTIADVDERGRVRPVRERATITRLGEGTAESGTLTAAAMERTADCLADYAREMAGHRVTRARAVGTSALRDARGGEAFRTRAEAVLGFPVEVISGLREAELTYRGAQAGLTLGAEQPTFVLDIGGGSTELVWGRGPDKVVFARSLQLGSVRLTEQLPHSDPWTAEELGVLDERVTLSLEAASIPEHLWQDTEVFVGAAGTVTSIAAIAQRLPSKEDGTVHGTELTMSHLVATHEELRRATLRERLNLPSLREGRADVIVAGAAILMAVSQAFERRLGRALPIQVSDRGVRYGVLLELARARHS